MTLIDSLLLPIFARLAEIMIIHHVHWSWTGISSPYVIYFPFFFSFSASIGGCINSLSIVD